MPSEFDLIQRFFTRPAREVILGVGDDAALIKVTPGMELAVSTDMLVSGQHFFPDTDPFQLGHKTLAVNLSDMAAMGATPRWATLSLALPHIDESWLKAFSQGFFSLADQFNVELVGGDTTAGPLNLCVQIMGEVPSGQALRRDAARVGDEIWVSGYLGDAALGLAHLQQRIELLPEQSTFFLTTFHAPQPRIKLGVALRNLAHSAIDISDGFAADLGHILERSHVGAEVTWQALPKSPVMQQCLNEKIAQQCVISGGDDYELCFTAAVEKHSAIVTLSSVLDLPLTCVGRITAGSQLILRDDDGTPIVIDSPGFDHFN